MKRKFKILLGMGLLCSSVLNAQNQDCYVAPGGNVVTHPGASMTYFGDLINDARGTAATASTANTGVNHAGGGTVYLFRASTGGGAGSGSSRIYDGPLATIATDNYNAGGSAVRFYNLITDNSVGIATPSGTVVNGTGGSGQIQFEQEVCISNLHTFTNGKVWTPRDKWKHAYAHYDANAATYTGAMGSNTTASGNALKMIDGYAAKTGSITFTFPIGDGIYTRFGGIVGPASGIYKGAYFAKNAPDNSTTGISGNAAGADGFANCNGNIKKVNRTEFWDFDGTASSQFMQTALNSVAGYSDWGTTTNFNVWTGADVVITGFDKWENLGITGVPGSLTTDGPFTTTVATAPDPLFSAYTWAVAKIITLQGTVFNDANGLTDNTVNGTGTGLPSGTQLYANLLDGSGNVIATVPVNANGTYSFGDIPASTTLNVQISTNQGTVGNPAPADALPSNWVPTGENVGSGTGSDGTVNQRTPVTVATSNVVQVNFGIDQLPNSNNVTQTVPQPSGGSIPASTISAPVAGTDPEDGTLGNSNTIVITSLATNGTAYYNGVAITIGQVITGFNPALLSFTGLASGTTSTSFGYAFQDAAGKQDPTPATYTVNWAFPLPVKLEYFTATGRNCDAIFNWKTSEEINFSKFEVERSTDGTAWQIATTVQAKNSATGSTYQHIQPQITGTVYYRLKMVDIDGQYKYSPVVVVKTECGGKEYMLVYPNPLVKHGSVYLSFNTSYKGKAQLVLTNVLGQKLITKQVAVNNGANVIPINIDNIPTGNYVLMLISANGTQIGTSQKVVKE